MTEPLVDLMCEPWCWPPEVVANLTDYQVIQIRDGQNKRIERAQKAADGKPEVPPPKPDENVRCGASYEYLIGTGLSPDEAEKTLRNLR